MPNVAQVLKQEIIRLARKEMRENCNPLRQQIRELSNTVNQQKKTIEKFQKTVERLGEKSPSQRTAAKPTAEEAQSRVRVSPASIKRLRDKLGISQSSLAQLLEVSTNTIVRWEAGTSTPRERHKQSIARVRGMGKREVKKLLAPEEEEE